MIKVEMLIIDDSRCYILCPNCYTIHGHGTSGGSRESHCGYPFNKILYNLIKTDRTLILNKTVNYKSDKQIINIFTENIKK
jgi:hypothetical protein